MSSGSLRLIGIALLFSFSGMVHAHTGHDTSGIFSGLAHPFGLDHLLAMFAVGVWSVSVLPTDKAWWGPAAFMTALLISAAVGAAGVSIPYLETLIAFSVVIFGAMLIISRTQLPITVGLSAIALAASLHGFAHGAETPVTGFVTYAAGFLITTATLHLGGVILGLAIRNNFRKHAPLALQLLGIGCGGAGLYLLGQM